MLSGYFKAKIKTERFKNSMKLLLENLQGKRVLIYGADDGFCELNSLFGLVEKLKPIAISDKKFKEGMVSDFEGISTLVTSKINNDDFDAVVITNERSLSIINFLTEEVGIDEDKIKTLFNMDIKDEIDSFEYLEKFDFEKNLTKLTKELNDKTVVIYGAGVFFEVMKEFFYLNGLNIVGISDQRFELHEAGESFLGYKVYAPSELQKLKPDYVLVATKFYIDIIDNLDCGILKGSKIKIKSLLKKPFLTLLKEIWS